MKGRKFQSVAQSDAVNKAAFLGVKNFNTFNISINGTQQFKIQYIRGTVKNVYCRFYTGKSIFSGLFDLEGNEKMLRF
jgi:hypothetical protein